MKRRTYRAFIILAVIAVVASLAIAVSFLYPKYAPVKVTPTPEPVSAETQLFENSSFSIHFFDVGEGDSALVECDDHYLLIDGGNPSSSSFLYSYLQKHKISYLDYIVCTHAHTDHVGGLAGALNYAKVGTAYAPVTEYDTRAFNSFVKYLDAQGKTIVVPTPGDTFSLGRATVTILGPIDKSLAVENVNNSSIVLRIVYGETSFLFTGDAEEAEELSLGHSNTELRSTLLKVGHHGSYTSSCENFIKAVSPEYAVISVGKDNEYGHPHDGPLSRLLKYCDAIYRTDLNGEIVVTSDGRTLSFSVER